MKKLKQPSRRKNQKLIPWVQKAFRQTYRDTPHSEIPDTALADSINFLSFDSRAKVRHGTRLLGDSEDQASTPLPYISNKSEVYTLSQSGQVVTKTVGPDFSANDVGNWIHFDTTNTVIKKIVGYLNVNEVNVSDSETISSGANRSIRGRDNGRFWHRVEKRFYIQLGNEVWFTDSNFSEYSLIINLSGTLLSNSRSTFKEYNGIVYLSNSSGLFLIDTTGNSYFLIRINTPNSEDIIGFNTKSSIHNFGRRYLTTKTRLSGSYFNDRTTQSIIKETGPNITNANGRDYGEIFYKEPILSNPRDNQDINSRSNGYSYTEIIGGYLENNLSDFLSISSGSIRVYQTVDDDVIVRRVVLNLSFAQTFLDIAEIMENSIRNTFPDANYPTEVYFEDTTSGNRFRVNGGAFDGGHILEFQDDGVYASGVESGPVLNKLVNGSGGFISQAVSVGDIVRNNSSLVSAIVTSIDSDSQLGLDSDIFPFGGDPYQISPPNSLGGMLKLTSSTASSLQHLSANHIFATGSPAKLSVPYAEKQWTHISLYGTPNIVDETNNPELYVWMMDRPIAKSLYGNVDRKGDLVVTQGSFDLSDVGSVIKVGSTSYTIMQFISSSSVRVSQNFLTGKKDAGVAGSGFQLNDSDSPFGSVIVDVSGEEDFVRNEITGEEANVLSKTSSSLTLDAAIFDKSGRAPYSVYHREATTNPSSGSAAIGIGASNLLIASQDEYQVVSTTSIFSSTDVGENIFWSDGGISIISEYVSATEVNVFESSTRNSLSACLSPDLGMSANDYISDELISSRVKNFTLKSRFWESLPSHRFLAIAPGFLFIAAEGGKDFFYSQLGRNLEYLAGHYDPSLQTQPVQDSIKGLFEMPEQIIIYCSRSTWRINTNVTNIVSDDTTGSAVAIISGVSNVDEDIGIQDCGGVQVIENGSHVLITSEPAVRIFDGSVFGENMSDDRQGRPFFVKDLESLYPIYASAYDPVMGFIFWGALNTTELGTEAASSAQTFIDNWDYTLTVDSNPWVKSFGNPLTDIGSNRLKITNDDYVYRIEPLGVPGEVYSATFALYGVIGKEAGVRFILTGQEDNTVVPSIKWIDDEFVLGGSGADVPTAYGDWTNINVGSGPIEVTITVDPVAGTMRAVQGSNDSGVVAINGSWSNAETPLLRGSNALGDSSDGEGIDIGPISWTYGVAISNTKETLDNITLTKSFRVGIKPEQAKGWCELNGEGWVYPQVNQNMEKVFSETNSEILVIIDDAEGRVYRLDKTARKDKIGHPEEEEGFPISWSVKFKEHKGERESNRIKHLQSHFYFRPEYESIGYQDGLSITARVYVDGSINSQSTIDNIPIKGELSFDRKIQSERIQLELIGTHSDVQLIEHDTDYLEIDTRKIPSSRNMTWHDYLRNIGNVIFWFGRGSLLNRASGLNPIQYTTIDLVPTQGPDSEPYSAYIMNNLGGDIKWGGTFEATTEFTVVFWVKNSALGASDNEYIKIGGTWIFGLIEPSESIFVYDGISYYYSDTFPNLNDGEWHCVIVVRDVSSFKFYIDGLLVSSEAYSANEFINETEVTISPNPNSVDISLMDVRLLDKSLSASECIYYYNDVVNNNGKIVLNQL